MFSLINFGLEFYENLFQKPYPFQKYDQAFVPNLDYLGMEVCSLTLLTGNYVVSDRQSTKDKKSQRSLTVLHELSHMYFGNCATMKWWDDIWLNESFAVFICHEALNHYIDQRRRQAKQQSLQQG